MKTPCFSGKVGGDDHPPYKQKYPYLNENLFILKEEKLYFLILLPKTFYAKINEDGFKILSLMDGITPLEAIVSDLSKDNKDTEKIKNFISALNEKDVVLFRNTPMKGKNDIENHFNLGKFIPVHVTIELTDKCNLHCEYCYRESGPERGFYLKHPKEVLFKLHSDGIKIVELSGGEPLLHPDFFEILKTATGLFEHISLLTNGTLLDTQILDFIKENAPKISLQISLPTLDKDRFKKITDSNALERVIRNIREAGERGVLTRVGMVLIDDFSYEELERVIQFSHQSGAKTFGLSPAFDVGRGRMSDISFKTLKIFPEMINRLNKLYGNMIPIIDTENIGDPEGIGNCGAGWRTYTVDPLKKMRPCPFFPIEFSSLSLANPEIRLAFFRLKSPNKETCNGCPYEYYCKGCIIRGYLMSRKMGFQCEWVKRFNVTEIFDRLKEDG